MSVRKEARKQSNFIKYLKLPIRVLARARDMYVQSMTGCAGHVTYGNAMGCPTPHIPSLPRSFSTNSYGSSREEDLRDLIRSASARSLNRRTEAELQRSKSTPMGGGVAPPVNRSKTVAIGRIDEDKAFEYGGGGDDVGLLKPGVYSRSRSYGLSRIISKRV